MDYRGALLKGLKVIPSSLSIKSRPRPVFRRNWVDLPPEVMVSILQRIGSSNVLLNAKFVCKSWHSLCKDPYIWQVVELRRDVLSDKIKKKGFRPRALGEMEKVLQKMAMQVVDLSSGQFLDLCIQGFGSNHLLQYIYQRSRKLRHLRLEHCLVCFDYSRLQEDGCLVPSDGSRLQDDDSTIYYEGLSHMLRNLPLLEDLELPYTRICEEGIESTGRFCPHLKSFTLNERTYYFPHDPEIDREAIAIAKYMPGLRNLQLFGNRMTVVGLMAILDNYGYLEYLDLRQCYNLCKVLTKESEPKTKFGERHRGKVLIEETDLKIRLCQQIKHVRFPEDSTEDYEFDDEIYDSD